MFVNCPNLNTDSMSGWDMSGVTNINNMFWGTGGMDRAFNGDITNWDVSNVTDFGSLFGGDYSSANASFNRDIGGWNTSSALNMNRMFRYATSFDQDLSGWDINQVTNLLDFMNDVTLSTVNYDALLIAWDAQGAMSYSGTVNFGLSKYTAGGAAEAARTSFISKWGGITDGGPA
jgi:surface protein